MLKFGRLATLRWGTVRSGCLSTPKGKAGNPEGTPPLARTKAGEWSGYIHSFNYFDGTVLLLYCDSTTRSAGRLCGRSLCRLMLKVSL